MKRKIFLTVLALAGILGAAFMPAPNSQNMSVRAASATQNGFVNLYDKDCSDKLAYGQVDDITQYHNNVGWVWDNITQINGQNSYTSGYIDIRGYSYFTTNNDKLFEIICYNADKEPIAWIAENKSASHFREGEKSGGGVVLLSMPVPDATYQHTINGRTLVAVNAAQEFGGNDDDGGGIIAVSVDPTKQIAFVRVAFPNSEKNPYFNAFTDDFEMLIKLNRDETSGGVMNALMVDIHDNVFTGFTLNETFEVGTI